MSCAPQNGNFRLLDAYVGWDPDGPTGSLNLEGLEDPAGLRLSLKNPGEIDSGELLARIPPGRLAQGCGLCEWYLATPRPSRLLRLDRCSGRWLPIWNKRCDPGLLNDTVAIAARGRRVAAADKSAGVVWIWAKEGERLSAAIAVRGTPGPIAFSVSGELLVTVVSVEGASSILRYGPTGDALGALPIQIPADAGTPDRLAVSKDHTVWLVTRATPGVLKLWKAVCTDRQFQPAETAELATAFEATGLTAAEDGMGFCLSQSGSEGAPVERCFSWYGRPVNPGDIPRPAPLQRQTQGQLLTQAIDSGIPRCRWHRVRITADVPLHATLTIAVSTSEQSAPPDQGVSDDPQWSQFPPGRPHSLDWQTASSGSLDFLIKQPPGRYLFVRMRLAGDGIVTPSIRCVRLDFPRSTSLEFLPPVYRENPAAEDFTERFLSLFDSTIADLDRAIERYPALLDPAGVPEEVLPWLGSFLDVAFDPLWEPERRRRILQAIPQLYRKRGTVEGLKMAFKLVFDVEPIIQEQAAERSWGILGSKTVRGGTLNPDSDGSCDSAADTNSTDGQAAGSPRQPVAPTAASNTAILRGMRLFGRSRTRFRLGNSPLSKATIRSYGNPDHDPLISGAYRFRILVPIPLQEKNLHDKSLQVRMEQLVESQKPSHTVATVRFAEGGGLLLGGWCAVGIDTVLGHPPQPILGPEGNVRLRGTAVLWPARGGRERGPVMGQILRVGIETVME